MLVHQKKKKKKNKTKNYHTYVLILLGVLPKSSTLKVDKERRDELEKKWQDVTQQTLDWRLYSTVQI